jgi:hypothetical protein
MRPTPRSADPARAGRLDVRSRLTLKLLALRSAILMGCMAVPWTTGRWSFPQAMDGARVAFGMAGLVLMFIAARRAEPVGGRSLNLWDEALALSGGALLLQILLHRVQW